MYIEFGFAFEATKPVVYILLGIFAVFALIMLIDLIYNICKECKKPKDDVTRLLKELDNGLAEGEYKSGFEYAIKILEEHNKGRK